MSSSAGRKNLIKLIKIIHPDVLASCGQETAFKVTQKVNLACIQNFQQLSTEVKRFFLLKKKN